jgi:hypothetical protein
MRCKVDAIPGALLAGWLEDGTDGKGNRIPAQAMAQQLTVAGHAVGSTALKDHRAQRCVCHRPEPARLQAPPKRVMTLDIERLPGHAIIQHRGLTIEGDFWDLSGWKHTIGYRINAADVTEWPRTICVAWRWYGEDRTEFASEWTDGQLGMLDRVWGAYDRADVVYGHNLARFDTKHLNTGWRDMGLPAPAPYKIVDTLTESYRTFGDESRTLSALTKRLGIDTKTDKYSVAMARAAVAGDRKAQRQLRAYNVGDVAASEAFVDRLRGWIPSHPHALMGSPDNGPTCNQCWGDNLAENGWKLADQMRYPLYRCQDCGGNVQGRGGVRVSDTRGAR